MQPIDDVEQIDRLPLLALCGVDRRQDQIIFVEQWHAGLIAGCVRRIQREFGQETFASRISGGDRFQLEQISPARLGILMDVFEMRFVPKASALQVDRPFRISKVTQGLDETPPTVAPIAHRLQ
jgi:hypothetical protein